MIETDIKKLVLPCEYAGQAEGEKIALQLIDILSKEQFGVGLAAPQIGINKQVFVIKYLKSYRAFINPVIIDYFSPVIFSNEGCLSFPGKTLETLRYREINFTDSTGIQSGFAGLPAIIFQHEYDHLNQKTMYDSVFNRIEPNSKCLCGSGIKFKKCCKGKAKKWTEDI